MNICMTFFFWNLLKDCSAFALQELLQIYKIVDRLQGEKDSRGAKLWKRFPEQLQEILIPLLTSRYCECFVMAFQSKKKKIEVQKREEKRKVWLVAARLQQDTCILKQMYLLKKLAYWSKVFAQDIRKV